MSGTKNETLKAEIFEKLFELEKKHKREIYERIDVCETVFKDLTYYDNLSFIEIIQILKNYFTDDVFFAYEKNEELRVINAEINYLKYLFNNEMSPYQKNDINETIIKFNKKLKEISYKMFYPSSILKQKLL